jgi:hypothetical protein
MYDVVGGPAHCAVRKLSPSGVHRWTESWEPVADWVSEFGCIAVARGLVYAGGTCGVNNTDSDIILAALDTAGTRRWFLRHDGPGGGVNWDRLSEIVIDADDNIYCGGWVAQEDDHQSAYVFSMRPDSTMRWEYIDTPSHPAANNMVRALCLSPEGHLFAAGDRNNPLAIFTVWCLDTTGSVVWVYEKQPYESDNPWDIGVDSAGNTIVTGSMVFSNDRDCYAMSFQPVPVNYGVTVGGSGEDVDQAICRTSDGGYAVVGYTNSFGAGGRDAYLVRFNSAAETVWTRTYGTTGDQYGWALVQRPDNGFVIAGFTNELGSRRWDLLLVGTDAAGNQQWYRTYGRDSTTTAAYSLALRDSGFLVAATRGPYGVNGQNDMYVLLCEPDGDTLWTRTYGTTEADLAQSITALDDGGFLLAGSMHNVEDLALLRADAGGTELWRRTYGTSGQERADAVAPLPDGGFAVAGYTFPSGQSAAAWLLVTDENGDTLWTRTADGPGDDRATGIVAVPGAGFGICGTTTSWGAGGTDIVVFGFDSLGNQTARSLFGGVSPDAANDACYATGGGYAVCGLTRSFGVGGGDLYLVIVGGPVAIDESRPAPAIAPGVPPATIVRGFLNLPSITGNLASDIALVDASGRRVLDLHPGPNDVSRLAPGIYFVRTTGRQPLATGKVVVTR